MDIGALLHRADTETIELQLVAPITACRRRRRQPRLHRLDELRLRSRPFRQGLLEFAEIPLPPFLWALALFSRPRSFFLSAALIRVFNVGFLSSSRFDCHSASF